MPEDMQDPQEGQDSESETSLVPKSLFGGDCKVGDKYTVEVVGKYEDELEIAPVKESAEEKKEPAEDTMDGAMSRMEKMGGPSSPDSNEGY